MSRSLSELLGNPWRGRGARTGRLLALLVLSQLGWFACVLGAAQGRLALGLPLAGACLAAMLWVSSAPARDAVLVVLAVAVGGVWDTWLGAAGIVVYASPGPVAGVAPAWILMLWALLGALLREPLAWLHRRTLLAVLLGGVGGALSYLGAVRLGAGLLPEVTRALYTLALGWAVMTPLLLRLALWLEEGGSALQDGHGRGRR